jgi:nucleotide-binding universal stress UspA family protein
MFKTIVVGTDGSATAARAVQMAADLAGVSEDAVLHIVCAAKPVSQMARGLADTSSAPPPTEFDADTISSLKELLSRAAEQVSEKAPRVQTHPRVGNPAEVLCELADQVRADLMVVGNRGMRGGRRFLGSVPNSVSHHAPCSVLIANTV